MHNLNTSIVLNAPNDLKAIVDAINANDYFSTPVGMRFKRRIQDMYEVKPFEPTCVVCGKPCDGSVPTICNKCNQAIQAAKDKQSNISQQNGAQSFTGRASDAINGMVDRWFQKMSGQRPQDVNYLHNQTENQFDGKATESVSDVIFDLRDSIKRIEDTIHFWNVLVILGIIFAIIYIFS